MSHEEIISAEISCYNAEKPALLTDDPLAWWKYKRANLSLLARKYLGMVATLIPSECLFSVAGLVNSKRVSLDPANVQKLVFLHDN